MEARAIEEFHGFCHRWPRSPAPLSWLFILGVYESRPRGGLFSSNQPTQTGLRSPLLGVRVSVVRAAKRPRRGCRRSRSSKRNGTNTSDTNQLLTVISFSKPALERIPQMLLCSFSLQAKTECFPVSTMVKASDHAPEPVGLRYLRRGQRSTGEAARCGEDLCRTPHGTLIQNSVKKHF